MSDNYDAAPKDKTCTHNYKSKCTSQTEKSAHGHMPFPPTVEEAEFFYSLEHF